MFSYFCLRQIFLKLRFVSCCFYPLSWCFYSMSTTPSSSCAGGAPFLGLVGSGSRAEEGRSSQIMISSSCSSFSLAILDRYIWVKGIERREIITVRGQSYVFRLPKYWPPGPVLRIRDVYPGSRILIFTHPGSRIQKQQQKRGVKKFDVIPFYVATNFTKLYIILVLKCWRKKMWANFHIIIELFAQKIVTTLSKVWVWDPGSGKKPIPDPGSRGQKGTGSQIPDPDPQHCPGPTPLSARWVWLCCGGEYTLAAGGEGGGGQYFGRRKTQLCTLYLYRILFRIEYRTSKEKNTRLFVVWFGSTPILQC